MNTIPRILAASILLLSTSTARAAEPPADIADLFSAKTLAFVELHNAAELAPELAALFKGTALEDSIPFIHTRKNAAKNLNELNGKRYLAALGLLASPEMLAEFKKLRVAVGLTGFNENGEPEFAVVVLTNDSPAAGVAARAFVTMTTSLRKVAEVAKVPIFQTRHANIVYDQMGMPTIDNEKPPLEGPYEPTFAYTPGLFVVGSSKISVSYAIERFVGKTKDASLSGTSTFREAAAAHRKTGLFYYLNFPEFRAKLDAANKLLVPSARVQDLLPFGSGQWDLFAWFQMTANPKAVKYVAGCMRFRDGGVSATMSASLDPALKSPLAELLSGPGVKVEFLHHAPRPVSFAISVTLPEKNRAATLLGFLDAIAKANGELGRLPSDAVREWEQKFKQPIADGLLGKTGAITIFLPTKQELPNGGKAMPTVVLHTEDAATASTWEELIPKVIGELSGAATAAQPSTETVNGVKVLSLAGTGLPWNAPVHYARNGSALAVGLDRKLVAAAALPNAAGSAVGNDQASQPPVDASAFGKVTVGDLLHAMIEKPPRTGQVIPKGEELPIMPNGLPVPANFGEELKKSRQAFYDSLAALPSATVTVRRVGNELQIELFQPKVQAGGLKAVIDAGANWLDKAGGMLGAGFNGSFFNDGTGNPIFLR